MKEIVLKPKLWKPILGAFLSIGFVILGINLVNKGINYGWFTIALFGLSTLLAMLQLIPNSTYLKISDRGIFVKTLFSSSELKWTDIKGFYTKKVFLKTFVMIRFADHFKGKYLGYDASKMLTNNESMLPDNYGKSAEELNEILNEHWSKQPL
ncbi:STM3941 family protein [Amniculibacterium aquaticum]|jgi:hypothetical protein|nr:STM3941 family protein [Amniculibacterium aquaticum]